MNIGLKVKLIYLQIYLMTGVNMKLKIKIELTTQLLLITVMIALLTNIGSALGSPSAFKLLSYNYKSSSGSEQIYPGSRNVQLIVEVQYIGNVNLTGVAGCLILPSAFTFSRNSQSCSPPYMPNGTTYSVVRSGDVMVFKYSIDVREDAAPGTYDLMLNITYRYVNETSSFHFEVLSGINVEVTNYPPIELVIINSYWTPTAYPGSEGVSLNIILENRGNSSIASGNAVLKFPSIIRPREVNVNIGAINVDDRYTITVSNLDISPDAIPNYNYQVTLIINATARTSDGVNYIESVSLTFNITLASPPILNLKIIDYGLTAIRNVNNLRFARIYVQFQVMDTRTISAITAVFNITYGNAFFANGSEISVSTLIGSYGYGDYFTIESDRLIINDSGLINATLNLTIFGSENGAEFWSIQAYNLSISLIEPEIELYFADSYWSSQEVYPGSADESLIIVVENLDAVNLRDAIATLILPSNIFEPQVIKRSGINVNSGSRATIVFQGININCSAKPGTYIAKLLINGIAWQSDDSFYNVSISYSIPIVISSSKIRVFELIDYGWRSGTAYTTSCNVHAYASLRIGAQASASNIVVNAYPSPHLKLMSGRMNQVIIVDGSYDYGDVFEVAIGPMNVTASSGGISSIVLVVEALVDVHGSEFWVNETFSIPLEICYPVLNLTLIDYGWYEGYASNESYGVAAYVTFQSFHSDQIMVLKVAMELNDLNAVFESGSTKSIWVREDILNYGQVVTAIFSGINVESNVTQIPVKIVVEGVVRQDGGYYIASKAFNIVLSLIGDESLLLTELSSIYRGSYAPILPSASQVVLRLEFINIKPDAISSADVNVSLPSKFKLRGIEGSIFNGVPGGSTCTLDLVMDVDGGLSPGIYEAEITISYFKRINNALTRFAQKLIINIPVESVSNYLPELRLVSWYWGVNRPITVFENERNVPLTFVIMNEGRYPVEGVSIEVASLSPSVKLITSSSFCAARLEPGASCRATLYVDLVGAGTGSIFFKVYLKYIFAEFGAHINVERSFQVSLEVASFAAGKGLKVVDYGWRNNWPVYPNTRDAVFTVTLANKWPYSISGLELKLLLPSGFESKFGDYAVTYISGPVDSLASITAEFTVSVGNVTPSIHKAKLIADYVVECGGAQLKVKQEFSINIRVDDLSEAVQLLTSSWYGASPEPGTYGAYLVVLIRNNYVKQIRGPVLEVYLPEGFTCSINNGSIAYIPPFTHVMASTGLGQLPPQQALISQLSSLMLSYMMGGSKSIEEVVSEGDIISFIVPLNIHVDRVGVYYADAVLNFIDHWDNVRRIRFTLPISIYGSTRMLEVYLPNSIKIVNGSALLAMHISNTGFSSIYDVYVAIIPQSPILIPIQNVKYISRIDPYRNVSLTFNLIYNPTSIMTGVGEALIQYTTLPLMVAVRFKDVLGYQHFFNISAAVLIEPFIDLRLGSDVKAELKEGSLAVSGTIINYGLSTARSAEVKVEAGNSTSTAFIGDVDSASQLAFRVDVPVSGDVNVVAVELRYCDDYGRFHRKVFNIPVVKVKPEIKVEETPRQPPFMSYQLVIAMVLAFLALSLILIYRYLKRHERAFVGEEVLREV